jgi:hypothetical protein
MNKTTLLFSAFLYLTTQPIAPAQAHDYADDLNVVVTCSPTSLMTKTKDYAKGIQDLLGISTKNLETLSLDDGEGPTTYGTDISTGQSRAYANQNLFIVRFSQKDLNEYVAYSREYENKITENTSSAAIEKHGYKFYKCYSNYLAFFNDISARIGGGTCEFLFPTKMQAALSTMGADNNGNVCKSDATQN